MQSCNLGSTLNEALLEGERRQCRSLANFVRAAWSIIEPGKKYQHNWHIDVICEHLEAVSRREIKRLLINVPFRTAKSTLTSVMWPAWTWTRQPEHQWLCGSYAAKLAIRDSVKMRRLITSDWYQRLWGDRFQITGDQNAKERFENDCSGYRIAFGMTGGVMGDGGDTVLIDDPHDRRGAHSDAEREDALTTYDEGIVTRLNEPENSAIVIIMQRLAERDLSGHVLAQGGWQHVMIPMEFEKARSFRTSIGGKDPRTQEGELMWADRFPAKTLRDMKLVLGDYASAGQLQQRPSPAGGGIIKTEHFQLWPSNRKLPDLLYVLQSYDTAFTEKTENDPTACTVWGIFEYAGEKCALLLDAWTEHMEYPELRKRVTDDWSATYGGLKDARGNPDPLHPPRRADAVLVEEKGSGQSLLQDLRKARVPVVRYNPGRADKVARAHVAEPLLELGVLYLLESKRDPGKPISWARPLVAQCEQFPNGEHDDLVDTYTQALIYLHDSHFLELPEADPDPVEDVDYNAKRKAKQNPYLQ